MPTSLDRAYDRIDRDLRRVESRAEQRVARALRGLRRQLLANPMNPTLRVPEEALEALTEVMLESDQMGERRSLLEVQRSRVQLAVPRAGGGHQRSAQVWRFTADSVLKRETRRVQRSIAAVVNRGVAAGDPPAEIAKAVRKKFDSMGVSPRNPSAVATIVRTHSAMAYSAGQWRADHSPEVRSALWGYFYATRGDDRVRPHHRDLDGVTLPVSDSFWRTFFPPNDWNCRCRAIPLYAEPKGGIVRAPSHVRPTRGFSFNPGMVFGS